MLSIEGHRESIKRLQYRKSRALKKKRKKILIFKISKEKKYLSLKFQKKKILFLKFQKKKILFLKFQKKRNID
jgi:hypothetical protein